MFLILGIYCWGEGAYTGQNMFLHPALHFPCFFSERICNGTQDSAHKTLKTPQVAAFTCAEVFSGRICSGRAGYWGGRSEHHSLERDRKGKRETEEKYKMLKWGKKGWEHEEETTGGKWQKRNLNETLSSYKGRSRVMEKPDHVGSIIEPISWKRGK